MRTRKIKIFHFSIFGFGIETTLLTGDGSNNDGSLKKFDIDGFFGKYTNPHITFVIFYRWLTFRLLLNRE